MAHKGQVVQHVPPPINQNKPQKHQKEKYVSPKRNLVEWFPSCPSSPQHHQHEV